MATEPDPLKAIGDAAGDRLESGDAAGALELYGAAVALAAMTNRRAELSGLLGDMAVAFRRTGDVASAIETNRRAIEAARECGLDLDLARWSGNLGGLLYVQDDFDGAEACFREAMDAAVRTGNAEQMAIAGGHLASMLGERKRFSEAAEAMGAARGRAATSPAARAVLREQELDLFVRWTHSLRSEGRLREAREVIERALATGAEKPPTKQAVVLLVLLGELCEREGDIVSASEAIGRAASASEALGDRDEAKELHQLARRMRG
jgi:tetratricopeptide (TPR) repeat protein